MAHETPGWTRPDASVGHQGMDWSEITAPGCYLHLASGLLARLDAEAIAARRPNEERARANRVVKLSDDPATPLATLRLVARRLGLPVRF